MSFSKQYKKLKPAVVAIVSKLSTRPDFPEIIGTGFIVDPNGLIVTNDHVVKAINKLPRRKSKADEWPIQVMYFHDIPGKGLGLLPLVVEGVGILGREKPIEGHHYGPDIPDIGMIYVKARELPFLEIEDAFTLNEGDEVFISGFPMGTNTLRAPGWIHQLTPVLQRGIVSAIQPFPCEKPHGLLIEAMTHGGSSGSPIFNKETGKVTALLYGGLIDPQVIRLPNGVQLPYKSNTCLTAAIPAYIINDILKFAAIDKETGKPVSRDIGKYPTLKEIIDSYKQKIQIPKSTSPSLEKVDPSDIVHPSNSGGSK